MEEVAVEVEYVEAMRFAEDSIDEEDVIRKRARTLCKPECARTDRAELRTRLGITAREQSDFVPLFDELLRQVGDDSFRAAVEARGHTLHER